MEAIVSGARGEEVTDDGIIKFDQLKGLTLRDLPNLKSSYQSKSEVSYLFDHQITFPKIKCLYLIDLKSFGEMQLWNLLATTQEHVHEVHITGCQVSTKVLTHHHKQSFRMIDCLKLKNYQGFKHVIDLDGTISIGEEQFDGIKKLELYDLSGLEPLWSKNLHEIGVLRSLIEITMVNCSQLISLFTHSMAMTLQHLKKLSVESCEMIEEIIIIEENNINFVGEEKATFHIEFPRLEEMVLYDLLNLKNFCNDERGCFSFSSLHRIEVLNCPKMKTFVSGQICLPRGMIKARVGDEVIEVTDLNSFFESRNEDNSPRVKKIIWWSHDSY